MIRYIAREIVHGGHWLALGTASIAAFCTILIGKPLSPELLLMAYLFSYGAYALNRYAEMDQDALTSPERTKHLSSRRKYLPFLVGSVFALGYFLALLRGIVFFLILLIPLALSFAYSVGSRKFVSVLGAKRLKDKLLVKNISISLGWSLVPVLVGIYYGSFPLTLYFVVLFVFLRLFVNTVFFDERDVVGDLICGVRTLPAVYGSGKTFRILNAVDIASVGYISSLLILGLLPVYSIVILIFPVYSFVYRWVASHDLSRLDFLCDVVGDGEYILWGAVLILGRIIIA